MFHHRRLCARMIAHCAALLQPRTRTASPTLSSNSASGRRCAPRPSPPGRTCKHACIHIHTHTHTATHARAHTYTPLHTHTIHACAQARMQGISDMTVGPVIASGEAHADRAREPEAEMEQDVSHAPFPSPTDARPTPCTAIPTWTGSLYGHSHLKPPPFLRPRGWRGRRFRFAYASAAEQDLMMSVWDGVFLPCRPPAPSHARGPHTLGMRALATRARRAMIGPHVCMCACVCVCV